MQLFRKDPSLFDLLESQARYCYKEAEKFHQIVSDFGNAAEHAQVARTLEHEADDVIRQVLQQVDATFVTPLDKEDVHLLATRLDDVTDSIESAVSRLVLYHIDSPRPDMGQLTDILVRITGAIVQAVGGLKKIHEREPIQQALHRIHDFESEGDAVFRSALADLFNAPADQAILVIKWKDIYERTEKAIDRCEHVGAVLETILVKYA